VQRGRKGFFGYPSKGNRFKMNSLDPECNDLKKKYDSCFNLWFTEKFLKGDTNDDMCAPLFVVYKECVREAITKQNINLSEVDKSVLGTESEKQPPATEESSKP